MSEEININKIVVDFVNHHIESFYNTGKDIWKGAADKVRLHLDKSYKDYLACVTTRYSTAKSFFIHDEPIYLYKFYVPMGISSRNIKINKASITDIASVNPFAVITGTGGSGKSMLMRHLFLDTILNKGKVPVFMELRELNQTEQSLKSFLIDTLHLNHFSLDEEYIEKALKAGHFALLFDGFDEIDSSLRKVVSKELFQLAKVYDRNIILVSSRPDNEFSGWPSFSVFQIDALSLIQACELVEKLPFDLDFKSKFLKELKERLFEEHKSFLSNPLLLSIMLLTYGQSADIPNKLSIFYSQAYEALFQRHDALKGAFQRTRSSKLDIQDFARVFSAFSIQTYDKRIFQMSKSQALDLLEKSKNILRIDFNSNDYLIDAEQAVCLLIEDGLMLAFAHRSFQEYFVARFIYHSAPEVQKKLIDKYSKNIHQDSVMHLLYEMNPELIERNYIIPNLEKLENKIKLKGKVGMTHYLRYIKSSFATFTIMNGMLIGSHGMKETDLSSVVSFALPHCGHLAGWTGFKYLGKKEDADNYFVRKYKEGFEIKAAALTLRNEFTRDLAAKGRFFSMRTLEVAFNIKKALIKKHQDLDTSLDEILSI